MEMGSTVLGLLGLHFCLTDNSTKRLELWKVRYLVGRRDFLSCLMLQHRLMTAQLHRQYFEI